MSDSHILDNNTITLTNVVTNINLLMYNYVDNIISIKDDWIRITGRGTFLKSSSKSDAIFKIIFNDETIISATGEIKWERYGGRSYSVRSYSVWSFDTKPDENQIKHIISYLKETPERSVALNELLEHLQSF